MIALQNVGTMQNVTSILGTNPLLWFWPTTPPGNGLVYQVSSGIGKWIEVSQNRREQESEDWQYDEDVGHQA